MIGIAAREKPYVATAPYIATGGHSGCHCRLLRQAFPEAEAYGAFVSGSHRRQHLFPGQGKHGRIA